MPLGLGCVFRHLMDDAFFLCSAMKASGVYARAEFDWGAHVCAARVRP